MEEFNARYTPQQWVDHYQKNYLDTLTLDIATRIIKNDMTNMARTCVSIGFHLKAVRDRELFKESGYETIWDYAANQFGLSMSSASRYMTINDMFSVGGNTPQLQDAYRNFSKSQLQEMISMSDEQRQLVTEDMTVKEIREIKNPKAGPIDESTMEDNDAAMEEVQIPGQMKIQDYPEVLPKKSVATSQIDDMYKRELLSVYGLPARTYPPESLIKTAGCGTKETGGFHDCFSCHMDNCQIRQEDCWCVEAPCGNPFPCTTLNVVENIRDDIGDRCQFVNHDLAEHRAGDHEPVPCCKRCDDPCGYECRRSVESRAKVEQDHLTGQGEGTDTEAEKAVEVTEELCEEYSHLTDYELLKAELDKAQRLLNDMLECCAPEDELVRRQKILVGALAAMKCDLDLVENPPEEPEQPELPVMKNNDQRKEWLGNYKDWGLWYEDEHIGAKFYKYDFSNGARLIAEEFEFSNSYAGEYTASYLHLVGGPEPPKNEKYGICKWQRHERYSRYPNSETELVEFLKFVQKGEL